MGAVLLWDFQMLVHFNNSLGDNAKSVATCEKENSEILSDFITFS